MHESAPAKDWRARTSTRAVVCLLSWWACGASNAADLVTFPSLPLQTGVSQPAPNVVFILDDSRSMTDVGGDALDTRLVWCTAATCPNQPQLGPDADSEGAGAPYTKNPISYDPSTSYLAWAYANNTNTNLVRMSDASYTAASSDLQLATGSPVDLSAAVQTYYVPKPSMTATQKQDRRNYYRYQILTGSPGKVVRAEWTNANNSPTMLNGTSRTETAATNAGRWNNAGGTGNASTSRLTYTVPANATRVVIATGGTLAGNSNPAIYVNVGALVYPSRTSPTFSATAGGNGAQETLTIENPTVGAVYQIGVWNSGTANIAAGMTLTVTYTTSTETLLGCTVHASNYGWKNCADVSGGGDLATTKVRAVAAEKQNYANWYQYHRTRMKIAKAGGSEAFATLDENYRVGLMGLYPTGSNQQVLGGSTSGSAPTSTNAGNLNDIIPVATNGGLFIGANRKNWFDAFHAMAGKNYTPLRKALNAAGKYFSTERAYRSTVGSDTTYLACRQNFTILTTDGYWNNFNNTDDPDSSYSGTNISGDEEDGLTITGPNNDPFKYERAAPYWYNVAGSDKDDTTTLADIAMHYWKTDLRTSDGSHAGSSVNKVPKSVSNPAFWQHMVTFGVGLGVQGKLTEAQAIAAETNGTGAYWPAPVHATNGNENPENVDDLRHAAFNSRGSFINANDSAEFASGIKDALSRIGERRGSASNVLANSTSISTESFVYQATYTAGSWRGELLAYPISSTLGLGDAQWNAGEHMAVYSSRNIFTATSATAGSTFPSSTQLSALGTAAGTLLGDSSLTTAIANYLKGDASREKRNGGALRNRAVLAGPTVYVPRVLGDIVDSSPFYVADNQSVFVGANDGMLHAFDASNTTANSTNTSGGGTERFAYIPLGVTMSNLAEMADPLYGTNTSTKPHRFFVDGPIVVSARARTPGKNYLVGALGRGGRGVYGLDVTTPGSFAAGNVLWDRTGGTVALGTPNNMGNVISEPLISKLNTGVTAAVVANGPNSVSGTASLYILSLTDGSVLHEFDTGTTANGLSAPRAVDVNADGKVDFFFAGDLQGKLWRFNVSSTSMGDWSSNVVFNGSTTQPISSAPGVARDPTTGKIWVFFGTGRYMTSDDQSSVVTQTYYGILVGSGATDNTNLTRASLEARSIHVIEASTGRRAFEPAETGVDASKFGWYIDLNDPAGKGERVISAPLVYDNILIFSSIVPPSASTVNSCDAGGSGYINALDAFSGTSLDAPFFAAIPLITDTSGVELPVGSLPINAGMPTAPIIIGDQLVVGDSSGGKPTDMGVNAPGGTSTKRVSWRELLNDL